MPLPEDYIFVPQFSWIRVFSSIEMLHYHGFDRNYRLNHVHWKLISPDPEENGDQFVSQMVPSDIPIYSPTFHVKCGANPRLISVRVSSSFQWPLSPHTNYGFISQLSKRTIIFQFQSPIHKLLCKLGVTQKEDRRWTKVGRGGGDTFCGI